MEKLVNKVDEIAKEVKKLAKNSEQKTIFQDIEFISRDTIIKERLVYPIDVGNGGEIDFKALYTYFSIPNVSQKNNKLKFKINDGVYDLELEPGAYEVNHINTAIQNYIRSNLIYSNEVKSKQEDLPMFSIRPDDSTGKAIIEIPKNCEVDFSGDNSIGSLLGFNKKILESGIHYSDNIVDLMAVNSISVCVTINDQDVFGNVVNGDSSNTLYSPCSTGGESY